jgi:biotin-dependent carboxylase-like uncharacterized protein
VNQDVFEVLDPGLSATLQDQGRPGWRRFGVPSSGAMDDHAAGWANRLLGNSPEAPVLELLLQGAKFTVLQNTWMAITGAEVQANVPRWRAVRVTAGEVIQISHNYSGLWIYLAVESGFAAPRLLGSASVYQRGRLGKSLAHGDVLRRAPGPGFQLPPGVAGRMVALDERRHYNTPSPLRVWPGPQWNSFSEVDRAAFFANAWTVQSQSDRVGYRLAGPVLKPQPAQLISEPVRVGSIQVPENGQPIVIMRDGPTVGGYPKLGLIDAADLSWLAQCRPGESVRFRSADEKRQAKP